MAEKPSSDLADLYDLLGSDIYQAYSAMTENYSSTSEELMKELNRAKEVLTDTLKRGGYYDETLEHSPSILQGIMLQCIIIQ